MGNRAAVQSNKTPRNEPLWSRSRERAATLPDRIVVSSVVSLAVHGSSLRDCVNSDAAPRPQTGIPREIFFVTSASDNRALPGECVQYNKSPFEVPLEYSSSKPLAIPKAEILYDRSGLKLSQNHYDYAEIMQDLGETSGLGPSFYGKY